MYKNKTELPEEIKNLFPFKSHYLTLPDGEFMHYVDEGEGPVLLLVHGNPTWPFFFRDLITHFRHFYRVIAPSHIGMGLSSKPQNYQYTLKQHSKNLATLLSHLEISHHMMLVHDWGGPIGLGAVLDRALGAKALKKLIVTNSAAFVSKDIPKRIALCRDPFVGEWLIRAMNAFAGVATFMASKKGLEREVKRGYLYPYRTYRDRVAISRFVQDIPLEENHISLPTLKKIEQGLSQIECPKLLLWGMKDFCFHPGFLERWKEIWPSAQVVQLKKASHYLFEDAPKECREAIDDFLKRDEDFRPSETPYKVLWDYQKENKEYLS